MYKTLFQKMYLYGADKPAELGLQAGFIVSAGSMKGFWQKVNFKLEMAALFIWLVHTKEHIAARQDLHNNNTTPKY